MHPESYARNMTKETEKAERQRAACTSTLKFQLRKVNVKG